MAGSIAPWINDPTQMSPSLNLGLSLLANSNTPGGFGSIFGKSALGAGQNYQQAQLMQQQIEQARMSQEVQRQKLQFMNQYMNGDPQQAPQAAPQGAQPPWMPQGSPQAASLAESRMGPQAAPQQSDPQQAQAPQGGLFDAPSPQDIASIPIGGRSPRAATAYSIFMDNKSPIDAEQGTHKLQLELAKEQYAPKLQTLEYLAKNDTPTKFIKADPRLMAAWPQLAAQAGLDPNTDFTDEGVRHAMTFAHNQIAASIGATPLPQTNKLITKELPDGRIAQIDPITGKQTIESASGLEKVIDPKTGKPILVPTAKAAGMTPFNQSLFGSGNISDQSKEMAYQYYLQHQTLPSGLSRSPAMVADMMNYISKRADQDGNSQTSILANKQLLQARQGAEKSFAPGGKDYTTTQFLNTAIAHLDTMRELAAGLNNNVPIQAFNKIKNAVSAQFGGTAPTNAAAAAQIVGSEVTKAIVANGGSAGERDEAAAAFSTAKTWPQLEGVINTYQQLLGGQLETRRNSYEQTFHRDDFNTKFLTARTRKALGIEEPAASSDTPAPSAGWGAVVVHK